jgi:hypothetical protein
MLVRLNAEQFHGRAGIAVDDNLAGAGGNPHQHVQPPRRESGAGVVSGELSLAHPA